MQEHKKHHKRFLKHEEKSKYHEKRAKAREKAAEENFFLKPVHKLISKLHHHRVKRHQEIALKHAKKHAQELERKYKNLLEKFYLREIRRKGIKEKLDASIASIQQLICSKSIKTKPNRTAKKLFKHRKLSNRELCKSKKKKPKKSKRKK